MPSQQKSPILSPPVSDQRDHVLGPPGAPVTLAEYGDYECPYCGQAHVVLGRLLEAFGDEIRLVFRNFPLTQIHPHAERAAEAAEAAAAQGKFWQMHHTLYEHQDRLDDESLAEYAGLIGLDVPRFVRDMAAGTYAARVREDFLSGARSGVNGTPTFFINGRRHDGPWDAESMTAALEAAGARAHAHHGRSPGRRPPGT